MEKCAPVEAFETLEKLQAIAVYFALMAVKSAPLNRKMIIVVKKDGILTCRVGERFFKERVCGSGMVSVVASRNRGNRYGY